MPEEQLEFNWIEEVAKLSNSITEGVEIFLAFVQENVVSISLLPNQQISEIFQARTKGICSMGKVS